MKNETILQTANEPAHILRIVETPFVYAVGVMSDGQTLYLYRAELEHITANPSEYHAPAVKDATEILNKMNYEEGKQKQADENRDRCKRIAEELEAYAAGDCVKCPKCGEIHYKSDFEERENEDGETVYICPDCGEEIDDPDDLETLSIYDYLQDVYNIEYRIDQNGELRSVEIMIACGGPNIYIDTERRAVCLHWWGDSAEYPINCADAVDDWAAEMWEATR